MTHSLADLPFRQPGTVTAVAWDQLSAPEAQGLRNMGLDEGVTVEALHCGPMGRDPLAIRIGRMTVAMRRALARNIAVAPLEGGSPA